MTKKKAPGVTRLEDEMVEDVFAMSDAEIEAIQASVEEEAQEAYRFADESPDADINKLYDFVYAETQG